MAAAKGIPPNETSGPLADMRHDALYNALVALSREMDVKKNAKQQGETEADKKYAEALDLYAQLLPERSAAAGDVLPAGSVLLPRTATTTRP